MTTLPPQSEKDFTAQVIALAKLYGWLTYHTYDSRRSSPGFPDLVMVRDRVIFAELKSDIGKRTTAQKMWAEALFYTDSVEVYLWRPEDWKQIERVLRRTEAKRTTPPPRSSATDPGEAGNSAVPRYRNDIAQGNGVR